MEVSSNINPPVCKFVDFAKFRYERGKKLKEARKKQKGGQLKEIRFRPKISDHDLHIKLNHAIEFFDERDKVRITVVFRGRENEHKDIGEKLLNKTKEYLVDKAIVETDIKTEGNRMSILYAPKKK